MRRLQRVALAAAAVVVALAGPAGAQGDGNPSEQLVLEGVDASSYPLVRAVVSGPRVDGELDDAFRVVEDGTQIDADVIRLRNNGLNVVVALDVSTSMKPPAIDQAKEAVAALLDTLPEGVPVSIVSFGDTATIQSAFTVDRGATMTAVNGLIAAGATSLYDGINLGLSQLQTQGGTGALIVLGDGDEDASTATVDETTAALAASDVNMSFVALETESFDAGGIRNIVDAARGQVITVDDSAQFDDAFRSIAESLGNVYEIRWRSTSDGDSADLAIALSADDTKEVSTSFAHAAVTEFVPDVALDTRTVGSTGILGASWLPLVAALCVTVGAAVLFLIGRNTEAATERREERLAGKQERSARRKNSLTDVQGRLNDFSAQMLEAKDRGRSLDDTLDRAGLAIRSNEFVVFCAGLVVASLLLGVVLFGIPFFLLGGLLPAIGIPLFLKIATNRRRKKFVGQLGDTLQLIVGSLTAGYGLGQTLDSVARETESPTSDEFSRVVMETRLGRSLEDALDAMSRRIQAPDFDWVVDAIKIQSSVGGNLSEIIEQVGDTIRARVRIKRQVDALTAEGKISALVLFVLPFGLVGFIGMTNPAYIAPLFSGGIGYVLLGTALTMISIGGLWLKKLVNPEF